MQTLTELLHSGAPFGIALQEAVVAEWRAADKVVRVDTDEVRCFCGTWFVFRPGATRARCPGCGARYEKVT